MKKSLKIFLACFLGAGIGTLTALQINGYFWWLGLLVGGFVGYLSYEFKTVIRTIPRAWRVAVEWKPNKKWWHNFGKNLLMVGTPLSNIVVFFSVIAVLPTCMTLSIIEITTCIVFTLVLSALMTNDREMSAECKEEVKKFCKYNPAYIYLRLLPKYVVLCLIWLVKGMLRLPGFIWKTIVILASFLKTLFILIHSEIRLLCGIDAAIGAAIEYFAGSVIIGALVGGVFGLLNYEIISVRVLHLNASKIRNT